MNRKDNPSRNIVEGCLLVIGFSLILLALPVLGHAEPVRDRVDLYAVAVGVSKDRRHFYPILECRCNGRHRLR